LYDARTADDARAGTRRSLRLARRALSHADRSTAERAIARRLSGLAAFRHARSVAFFIPFDTEPDLRRHMATAHDRGKRIYVPVLRRKSLAFVAWRPDSPTRDNKLGIPEPIGGATVDPRSLDLVLCPLLAFDDSGTRLGYGGGYYDRCLRFLSVRQFWHRPKLIGIAFAFQRLEHIRRQPWDIPLWGAITDTDTYRFQTR
jgi:5-formyltetrahydrofolate cyclo-ligase